ncbi:hypothetical protein R8Z50_16050 [Longispora sp. K20-0274]|uniref:MauE/DoxX family redox-associated membrane protein n=1 Tax=Longispora sp. K20-0274 TaxID=3088255 RepID=UPI00399A71D5
MVYVAIGARALVGLVLLVSVVGKLRGRADYARFVATVPAFGVPRGWSAGVAAVVATVEVLAVLLLAVPATVPAGGLLAGALFVALTAGVWRAVSRRTGAVCRCFGPRTAPLGYRHVVRNAVLCAVAGAGLLAEVTGSGPGQVAGLALAVAVGLVGAVLVIRSDDIVDLFTA